MAYQNTLEQSPLQRSMSGIKRLIVRSAWTQGTRLPAEESLAKKFSVSRATLRKALDELERAGVVKREANRGCVVATVVPSPAPSRLMGRSFVVVSDMADQPDTVAAPGTSGQVKVGLVEAAEHRRRGLLFLPLRDADESAASHLVAERPAGVIVLGWSCAGADAIVAQCRAASVPVVVYGEANPSQSNSTRGSLSDVGQDAEVPRVVDRVVSDHTSGTEQLVRFLAEQGRRRLLRLWSVPEEIPWLAARNRGFERAIASHHLPLLPAAYVKGLPERQQHSREVFELRTRFLTGYLAEHLTGPDPIDAIFVTTDCEAFNAAAACRLLGKEPGRDVAIVGYDNAWPSAGERRFETSVPIASIDKQNSTIGSELIRVLNDRVAGRLGPHPQVVVVPQRMEVTSP